MCFAVLVLLCAVPTQAWQGRMAGMGGVYGLVEDESDFLTHPALIANGQGLNFYGNMNIGVLTTDKMNYSVYGYEAGDPTDWWTIDSDASGRKFQYEGLFGGALPLGKGRIGVFFQYTGFKETLKGDYIDGYSGGSDTDPYKVRNPSGTLSLRILYGIPVSSTLKFGAEFEVAQKKEEIKNYKEESLYRINDLWSGDLFSFGIPYDSEYYKASMKASVETAMGPGKAAFTLRGGVPFNSSNHYKHDIRNYGDSMPDNYGDMSGKVKGYDVGVDAWMRLPLNQTLSLPFLLSVNYGLLKRDGDGFLINPSVFATDHEQKRKILSITTGGGVDYTPVQGTRVAGGLYYTYLKDKTSFSWTAKNLTIPGVVREVYNWDPMPKTTEHKISLKGSVEKTLSSDVSLIGGLNAYYGRLKQKGESSFSWTYNTASNSSTKGSHWGAGASLGASIKAGATVIEPYVAGGFDRMNLSGDGTYYYNGGLEDVASDIKSKVKTWSIGGGISMRF